VRGKEDTPDATASALDRWRAWEVVFLIGGLSATVGFFMWLVLWIQTPLSPSFERSRVPIVVLLIIGLIFGVYLVTRSLQWYRRAE